MRYGLAGILLLTACAGAPAPTPRGAPEPVIDPAHSAQLLQEAFPRGDGRLKIAEVAGAPIYAADVYPLVYLTTHDATREAVRQTVIDRLVELERTRTGVEVPTAVLEAEVTRVREDYENKIRQGTRGEVGLEEYVPAIFGLEMAEYDAWVRRQVTTSLLLERLILNELRGHPRWQVRMIRVQDLGQARELLEKLQRGADFGVLAREYSDDGSAASGGLYPALPADIAYPLFEAIGALESGAYDEIREVETEDGPRYRILQMVGRTPAQSGGWLDWKDEIEAELDGRVVSPLELDAWMRLMEQRYEVRLFGIGTRDG